MAIDPNAPAGATSPVGSVEEDTPMTREERQDVAGAMGAAFGLVATAMNVGTADANAAFQQANQNYQVSEAQNQEFLKLLFG